MAREAGRGAGPAEAGQDSRAAAGARIEEDLRALRADVAALAQALRDYGVTAAAEARGRAQGRRGQWPERSRPPPRHLR